MMRLHAFRNVEAAAFTHSDWLKLFWTFDPSWFGAFRQALYGTIFLGQTDYNFPLWTMRIEFIGSLLIFGFYSLLPESRGWRQARYYLLFGAILGLSFTNASIYYFAFLLGSLIWLLPRVVSPALRCGLFVAGIYFGAFQFGIAGFAWLPDPRFCDAKTFYNVIGGWLVLWALYSGFARSVFASRPMVFLGRISFSFYLLQGIVVGSFSCWLYLALRDQIASREVLLLINLVCTLALTIVCAAIFERLFDRSGVRWSKRLF